MATIYEKFPHKNVDADLVRPYPIAATFTGVLVNGEYIFNESLEIYESSSNDLIVMDGMDLSASIDQLDFNKGLNNEVFEISIIRGGSLMPVTLSPFKFNSFNQGANFSTNWKPSATQNNLEKFFLKLKGSILQHPDIASEPEIKIHLVSMLYLCKSGFEVNN